jgi:hypothetical protein
VVARLLAHPDAAPRDAVRARALAAAGRLAWIADHCPECARVQEEALQISRELGNLPGVACALIDLAFLAIDENDLPRAHTLLDEASALAESMRDPRISAQLCHTRAALAATERDFVRALALEEESLRLYREAGDIWQVVICTWSVGLNAAALGNFDLARAHLTECIQVGLGLGNRWAVSYPIEAFATLAVAERQYARAAALFGAAEAHRNRSGIITNASDHPASAHILAAASDFNGSAIDAARGKGQSLTADAAIAFALDSAPELAAWPAV